VCGTNYTGYVATEGPLPKKGARLIQKRGGGKVVMWVDERKRPKITFVGTGTYPSGKTFVEYEFKDEYVSEVSKQREDTFRKSFTWGKDAATKLAAAKKKRAAR